MTGMSVLQADSPSRRLRAATAALHARVEEGIDILRRTETLEGYVELLARMESFYRPFEQGLRRTLLGLIPAEFLESRVPRLQADLRHLAPDRPALPDAHVPTFVSPAAALGGLYVLEGAAIGGQIVARHLEAAHGLTSECGASFFASGGEAVGARWKAFRSLLDEQEDCEAMEGGAATTFLAFERVVVGVV